MVAGETFLALKQGLQNALWELGGVPEVIRSDNTSALTHGIKRSRDRALNDAYAELLDHYCLRSTRINLGESHENGVAEQAHYRLKDALDQALMLRGSRDFDSADDYLGFVRKVVERRNRLVRGKLEQERPHLQPLPPAPVPEYVNYRARVRKWSTIQAAGRTYTVPSRLIGKEVHIRLYAGHLEVYYKDHLGNGWNGSEASGRPASTTRHVIGSLVRKPGGFRPLPVPGADVSHHDLQALLRRPKEVARRTGLMWSTCASCTFRRQLWESTVDSALSLLLEAGEPFDFGAVKNWRTRLRRRRGAEPARDA